MSFNPDAAVFVPKFMMRPAAAPVAAAPAAKPAAAPAPAAAKPASPAPAAAKPAVATPPVKAKTPPVVAKPVVAAPAPAPVALPAAKEEKLALADDDLDDEEGDSKFTDAELAEELKKIEAEEKAMGISTSPKPNAAAAVDDPRENINIVFIGHVDAGKSTISGNILISMGKVDERTVEKYKKEAKENNRETWWGAYVMDQIEEEKARGKTIEVGRALFDTPARRYTILDAPGHKSFVPNMIAGAAQADLGVLVISAKRGEFESGFEKGGQTCEHAQLAKTAGIQKLVVVINKMDEVEWEEARYNQIVAALSTFLQRTCQYNPKTDIQFLPISGQLAINLTQKMDPKVCPWYTGPSLLEVLDTIQLQHGSEDLPARLPVIDKYKDGRGNTTIMGKIETGTLKPGDQLMLCPTRTVVEVVAITIDEGSAPMRCARPGENVRVIIKGESADNINSGFLACAAKFPAAVVTAIEAQVVVMDLQPPKSIFSAGYQAIMHIHTAVEECTVVSLDAELDRKTGKVDKRKRKPGFVKTGAVVICHIELSRPVAVEKFSEFQRLGRFTLRDSGKTVAFGKVLSFN